MFAYYGWISVKDSSYDGDEVEMNEIIQKIMSFIEKREFNKSPGFINFHHDNGAHQLLVSGMRNRFNQDVQDVMDLYQLVANIAPYSYGLLYTWDMGSPVAYNEFEVYVLARGKIRKEKDPFLSPCIPVIEDPDTGFPDEDE